MSFSECFRDAHYQGFFPSRIWPLRSLPSKPHSRSHHSTSLCTLSSHTALSQSIPILANKTVHFFFLRSACQHPCGQQSFQYRNINTKSDNSTNCSAFLDTRLGVTSYIHDAPKYTQCCDLKQSLA